MSDFRYRVQLRREAEETPPAEHFSDGELLLSSVALHGDLPDESSPDEVILTREGDEPIVYELDEFYELLLGWVFLPLSTAEAVSKPERGAAHENEDEEPEHPLDAEVQLRPSLHEREVVISLLDCSDYEAAAVYVNGDEVFRGNYWDFHGGAMGTTVAKRDLSDSWDSGVKSLVGALKSSFEADGFSVITEVIVVTEEQYEGL